MASGSQQLAEDYEQLKSTLELYPKVNIISTEGQPPDNYEIEYALQGYVKGSDGSVTIEHTHRVRISLPFGYPHFPPSVKPITNIFHPDVDPAAIRIADKWQENPSLADLTVYIGEMISGNVYNLEDPFNQEAADWYRAHQASLPLDALNIADIEESFQDIDSLVDDTFASLGLETDAFLQPEKDHSETDIQDIRELIDSKQIYSANKRLAELSPSANIPDLEALQQSIGKKIRKIDQLYSLVNQLEDVGKFDEALEVIDSIYEIASDAPGAEELRERIEQAGSFTVSRSQDEREVEIQSESSPKPPKFSAPSLPKMDLKKSLRQLNVAIPFKLILAALLILALCIGGISLYFKDQNIISRTQANILRSRLLVDKMQFDAARETLESAVDTLSGLTILRFRKSGLENEITELLQSKEMREGLIGNVLYHGDYMPASVAEALRELTVLTEQAKDLVEQNNPANALTLYRQALAYAKKNDIKVKIPEIENTIKSLELQLALSHAEQAEMGQDWKQAAETYRQALELSRSLSDPESANEITQKLTAASFRLQLDKSKKSFTHSEWQETVNTLEQAQKMIDQNPEIVTARERQDLHRLLVNSTLYKILSAAREAYHEKDWPKTISQYQEALDLLAAESANFEGLLDDSIRKIKKTLLKVRIAQIQEKVLIAESKKDPQSVINHSQDILRMIASSPLQYDEDIKNVSSSVGEQIEARKKELELNRKIEYLKQNFVEIFRANYPTFKGSKLQSPKVTFLRKSGDKHIFSISCIERSQGSSSRLELNYMYDEKTKTWSVYNG